MGRLVPDSPSQKGYANSGCHGKDTDTDRNLETVEAAENPSPEPAKDGGELRQCLHLGKQQLGILSYGAQSGHAQNHNK